MLKGKMGLLAQWMVGIANKEDWHGKFFLLQAGNSYLLRQYSTIQAAIDLEQVYKAMGPTSRLLLI